MSIAKFSPKDPLEVIALTFDFKDKLPPTEKITGVPSVLITTYSGVDASPSTLALGAPAQVGDKVTQLIRQGVDLVEYLIRCTVSTTPGGLSLTIGGILPVKRSGTY